MRTCQGMARLFFYNGSPVEKSHSALCASCVDLFSDGFRSVFVGSSVRVSAWHVSMGPIAQPGLCPTPTPSGACVPYVYLRPQTRDSKADSRSRLRPPCLVARLPKTYPVRSAPGPARLANWIDPLSVCVGSPYMYPPPFLSLSLSGGEITFPGECCPEKLIAAYTPDTAPEGLKQEWRVGAVSQPPSRIDDSSP